MAAAQSTNKLPDSWIKRDKRLIPLTGEHPFNAEPPLTDLMSDLITPTHLHYVRNHAAVPKLSWDDHRIKVDGLVRHGRVFSMDELTKLPTKEVIVTMACDGNRRGELNTLKHTRGFNWGAGGCGTAKWKGVALTTIIDECGGVVDDKARFVCFDGADQPAKGTYGTSVAVGTALDPMAEIIIAFEMNGERLPPDHGFPVRVIMPGFVGGRMVKWLSHISITTHESQSWYHYNDNKVLPFPEVDLDTPPYASWWKQSEYTLYELNVNSVIATPEHGQSIDIRDTKTVTVSGFAYSGNGRRITCVQVSTNGKDSWKLAELKFPENAERPNGRVFAWCHWSVDLDVLRVIRSRELAVRAWDVSCNTQPSEHSWNVLGMMNNAWYRVRVEAVADEDSLRWLSFKHPTLPACGSGGWLGEEHKLKGSRVLFGSEAVKRAGKQVTWDEVRRHCTNDDCWVVIDRDVVDVTSYMKDHPGGVLPLLLMAGQDASHVFHQIHGQDAEEIKNYFSMGVLVDALPGDRGDRMFLHAREWVDVTLDDKKEVSHDTRIFVLKLPHNRHGLLPTGQHILLGADMDGKFVVRPYTPIQPVFAEEDNGHIHLMIKIYSGTDTIPPGKMTSFLDGLKIGAQLKIKGPAGPILYHGGGLLTVNGEATQVSHLNLIAGGTGITPIYHLIRSILHDKNDTTTMTLLFSNKTIDDILLRDDLDQLEHQNSKRLHIVHIISQKAPPNWPFETGHLNEHIIRRHLAPPNDDCVTLLCGPPPMIERACRPALKKRGYSDDRVFEF